MTPTGKKAKGKHGRPAKKAKHGPSKKAKIKMAAAAASPAGSFRSGDSELNEAAEILLELATPVKFSFPPLYRFVDWSELAEVLD